MASQLRCANRQQDGLELRLHLARVAAGLRDAVDSLA